MPTVTFWRETQWYRTLFESQIGPLNLDYDIDTSRRTNYNNYRPQFGLSPAVAYTGSNIH